MGTMFSIVLYAPDVQTATHAAQAAFARVEALNRIMTDYDPDSELMRLCREPAGRPVKVSPELFDVLQHAARISRLTDGAFDITAGEYVQLWRRARRQKELPTPERLARVRGTVGWEKVMLDEQQRTVTLLVNDMHLDLGGIAKGYAADAALATMRHLGIRSALVAASGDIALGDPPPGDNGWTVGVASLDAQGKELTAMLKLARRAISTSGDTEQYVEIGGVRYSHIVDPRTGLGLTNRLGVTVVADRATTTDAMATAISVMGIQRGMQLADHEPSIAVLMVAEEGGRKVSHRSSNFPEPAKPSQ